MRAPTQGPPAARSSPPAPRASRAVRSGLLGGPVLHRVAGEAVHVGLQDALNQRRQQLREDTMHGWG